MSPNKPKTELKISITSTLTNLKIKGKQPFSPQSSQKQLSTYKLESAASANAALLPLMPTETPHIKSHMPTVRPDQKRAYPVYWFAAE